MCQTAEGRATFFVEPLTWTAVHVTVLETKHVIGITDRGIAELLPDL
jgi:hypothetical protein